MRAPIRCYFELDAILWDGEPAFLVPELPPNFFVPAMLANRLAILVIAA